MARRRKSEAEVQTLFSRWLSQDGLSWIRSHGFDSGAFELKVVDCVKESNRSGIVEDKVRFDSGLAFKEIADSDEVDGVGLAVSDGESQSRAYKALGCFDVCRRRLGASRVSEGQIEALERVSGGLKSGGLAYKISDSSLGYKPFDCFLLSGGAWVVVGWRCRGSRGGGSRRKRGGADGLPTSCDAGMREPDAGGSVDALSPIFGAWRAYAVSVAAWCEWLKTRRGREGLSEEMAGRIGVRL